MIYTDGTHLVADTLEELHEFARALGFEREWFQDHPRHPHYDLTTARAAACALAMGVQWDSVLEHGIDLPYRHYDCKEKKISSFPT